jgi:hypothetical protein
LNDNTEYRLELTDLPTYLQSSAEGVNSDANVRFVNTVSCDLDFGVHNPAQFCQTSPGVVTTCFVNGDPDHANSPTDTIVSFDYDGSSSSKATIGFKAETGSTWGVAYDSKRDQLYTAAVLRRHVGMGPAGAGGIYAITAPASAAPGVASEFYDLTDFSVNVGAVPDNTARGLDGIAPTALNHDSLAFPLIGKVSLGDLEISNDGNTLYVTNLADKKIYTIDLDNPSVAPNTLPDFPTTTCDNGEARPWALKVRDDKLYLGVICSAEDGAGTAFDLNAYVYAYDGVNWSTAINDFALDYPREKVVNSPASPGEWTPWRDTIADFSPPNLSAFGKPTPILSDIEFDDQGNMILGFTDRTGLQFGALNWGTGTNEVLRYQIASGGDILKAITNNDGTYTVENITVANQEFYNQDFIAGKHNETAQGGLAVLPGSNQVITVGMDPLIVNTGGIYWFSNVDGAKDNALQLYAGRAAQGLSGKAVGLGDLELMCQSAPLEVGNRLWCDSNSDGIQTPGELGVGAGIDVTMTCGGEFATIQTDANGKYLFTDVNWAASANTTSNTISRATACTIDVNYSSASATIASACSYTQVSPATQNADSDSSNSAQSDLRDSDAFDTGTLALINFTTGQAGENNHSLDIGFTDGAVTVPTVVYDWGDAPDSYGTDLNNSGEGAGAQHAVITGLQLGNIVDDEINGIPSIGADGDDNDISDDEDGVVISTLTDGQALTLNVTATNTTSKLATLICWIDYNADGVFATDGSESGGAAVPDTSNNASIAVIMPDVPTTASTVTGGSSYARCRLSTDSLNDMNATGIATDGEVEDYLVSFDAVQVSVMTGSIEIIKSLSAVSTAPASDWQYSLSTTTAGCTIPGSASPFTIPAEGGTTTISDLPVNGTTAACEYTATLTAQAGYSVTSTTGAGTQNGDSVTGISVTDGGTTAVGFICTKDLTAKGSIEITKSLTVGSSVPASDWIYNLSTATAGCTVPVTVLPLTIPAAGGTLTIGDLPVNGASAICEYTATLTAQTGYSVTSTTGAGTQNGDTVEGITVNDGGTKTVGFICTEDSNPAGSIEITKSLSTGTTPPGTDWQYSLTTSTSGCAIPGGASPFMIPAAGGVATISDLPVNGASEVCEYIATLTAKSSYTVTSTNGAGIQNGDSVAGITVNDGDTTAVGFICAATDPEDAGVNGVVFIDQNKNGVQDPGEGGQSGWTIKIFDSAGSVVETLTTQADGTFTQPSLGTGDFTVQFISPGGLIMQEQQVSLTNGDQQFVPQPIDPSGVIYDEVTGAGVPGAQVFLTNGGTPVPAVCVGAGEQGQVTGADGAYMFFVNPGADPACPAEDTVYELVVVPPTGFQTSGNSPQASVLDADNCTIDAVAGITCEVSAQSAAPINGIPLYFIQVELGAGDPGIFNNHIPLNPSGGVAPPPPVIPVVPGEPTQKIPTLSEWARIILVTLMGLTALVQHRRRRKGDVNF